MTNADSWLKQVFQSVDEMDAVKFGEFLTQNAKFQLGNMPVVEGQMNIIDFVGSFFSSIAGISHDIEDNIFDGKRVVCHGTVTYTRHNGTHVSYPFTNWFYLTDGLVADYKIYIDSSTLYAE